MHDVRGPHRSARLYVRSRHPRALDQVRLPGSPPITLPKPADNHSTVSKRIAFSSAPASRHSSPWSRNSSAQVSSVVPSPLARPGLKAGWAKATTPLRQLDHIPPARRVGRARNPCRSLTTSTRSRTSTSFWRSGPSTAARRSCGPRIEFWRNRPGRRRRMAGRYVRDETNGTKSLFRPGPHPERRAPERFRALSTILDLPFRTMVLKYWMTCASARVTRLDIHTLLTFLFNLEHCSLRHVPRPLVHALTNPCTGVSCQKLSDLLSVTRETGRTCRMGCA